MNLNTGKAVKILVIEDDLQLQMMLRLTLEKSGYTVLTANNGAEGFQRMQETPADLVITDIFMPQEDGIVAITKIKKDWPTVKILAMSGGAPGGSFDFLPVAQSLGANAILHKPFSREALLKELETLINS